MFENLQYKIGDEFVYRNSAEEPSWRVEPTIFSIDDILYSLKDNKIVIKYSYYNDSIDSGSGTMDLDEFEQDYKLRWHKC